MFTDYVLGFAFDQYDAVALIRKARPDWQKGRWNGIGGKREPGEDGPTAMAREFREETGMITHPGQWRVAGQLIKDGVYRCLIYTDTFNTLTCHTCTDEVVKVFTPLEQISLGTSAFPALNNVRALIELCRMGVDREGKIPVFELDYSKGSHA